ncbi:hypothetical protein BDR26DRAFT_892475 [Obelidium mucronatum]|nr:hypothetical protein BDR26DRAFT_892475 [Obelidium mucronatum]
MDDYDLSTKGLDYYLFHARYGLSMLLAIGYFVVCLWLVYFIVVHDLPSKKQPPTIKNIFNVYNTLLLGIWFFGFTFHLAFFAFTLSRHRLVFAFIGVWLSYGAFETCYVWFSWFRSESTLKKTCLQTTIQVFRIALAVFPFISISPLYAAQMFKEERAVQEGLGIFSASATCALDVYFTYSFNKYMRKIHDGTSTADPQLAIIGKYGRYSSAWCLMTLGVSIASYLIHFWDKQFPNFVMIAFFTLGVLKDASLAMVGVMCVMLKVALYRQQEKQRKSVTGNSVIFRDSYSSAPDLTKAAVASTTVVGLATIQKAVSASSIASSKEFPVTVFQAASGTSGSDNSVVHSSSVNDLRKGSKTELTGALPMTRQRSMGQAIVSRPGSFIEGGKVGLDQLRKQSIRPRSEINFNVDIIQEVSFVTALRGEKSSEKIKAKE